MVLEPLLVWSRSLKVLALAGMVAAFAGCDRQSADSAQPGSAPTAAEPGQSEGFNGTLNIENRGAEMPDITVTDPAGKTLRLPDLKGKPLLVNLWATWCGPCVLEMPALDTLAANYDGKLRVVTVSQDMEGAAKVKPFLDGKHFRKLEAWMDPENQLGFHYNTGMLPTTVLYDAQGREVWRMIGAHDWSGPRTEAMLADTLGK